jgi:hypothetical protein
VFEGGAALGNYAQQLHLGLALDPTYIEGFVEGCLERMGEDDPEDEALFGDLWEDEGERETVLWILKAEREVLPGRPEDYFLYSPKPRSTSLQRPY